MTESARVLSGLIHHFHNLSLFHGIGILFIQIFHELELIVVFILAILVLALTVNTIFTDSTRIFQV